MRVLPFLVLLCAAVVGAQENHKECREFGDICGKYKNCVPDHRGYLQCRNRHQLDGAAHLCRFGGDWCPDGKLCKKTSHGRRCVWDHKNEHEIKKCSKSRVTKYCAQGRKCMHCYLRKGLCCRRAAIIDHKNYCGIKYKSHDHTACGHQHDNKSSCYLVGKFCPDGKHCKKIGHGKYTCESKKKLPKCHEFGQLCGKYHKRNCVPCFSRKGLCCRRRSKLGPAAKHCRYGGKWCPKNKTCKQKSRNGIVLRRCIYIPRCKHYGDTCGYKKNKVCLRCGHKLCCKKGVTKDKCKKHCNVFWKKCTMNKCGHNSKGWCCKPWKITRDECDRHCIGRWKYCTDKGCSKDYIGYCCKSQPYITKKQCQQICYGPDKYCTNKFCPRDFRGHCCKTRRPRPRPQRPTAPHVQYCKHAGDSCGYKGGKVCQRCSKAKLCCRPGVTMEKCKRTCTGKGQYCSFTECPKAFKGWCCTYCKRSNCKLL
ncbi:uncharacterized protein LOC122393616 [Amphibalanus amphitrite]|uniref:uncharacterized protein LOC122393616 n=1 Tax=Amphibalanus amphitrite TaxID=1232801 RepID=UPI001C9149AE|nr:uncharacterized protein LOC122393616 [Amphibalanus amphitrite]